MKKKLTVTIGIPSYNEESNIAFLLDAILKQRAVNFVVEKIIVVCDGCTDKTEEIAREFAKLYPHIMVVEDGKRTGKNERLNFIYRTNASDALITLDADIELADDFVFQKLLEPLRDPQVAVVAGNARPLSGRTFVEKLVVAKEAWWYETRKNFKGGNNIYNRGCCFALTKDFTQTFQFLSSVVGEQEIIYIEVLNRAKRFIVAYDALIYFREASTWRELLVRTKRLEQGDNLKPYGFATIFKTEYKIPIRKKLLGLWKVVQMNPFYGMASFLLNIILKLIPLFLSKTKKNNPALWEVIASTKKLYDDDTVSQFYKKS